MLSSRTPLLMQRVTVIVIYVIILYYIIMFILFYFMYIFRLLSQV